MKPGKVRASVRVPPPIVLSPSMTRTDLPARASVMAAARPLGPEPTTTASHRASAKVDDGALRGRLDQEGPAAMAGDDGIDLVVRACRIVMKEQEPLRSRFLREADGVLDGGVSVRRTLCELGAGDLAIVDQQVRGSRQGDGGRVIRPKRLRSRSKGDRAVVGEVGDGRAVAADAVAVGEPALVPDLARDDLEAFDRPRSFLDPEEPPLATQLGRPDGEVGWRHDTC